MFRNNSKKSWILKYKKLKTEKEEELKQMKQKIRKLETKVSSLENNERELDKDISTLNIKLEETVTTTLHLREDVGTEKEASIKEKEALIKEKQTLTEKNHALIKENEALKEIKKKSDENIRRFLDENSFKFLTAPKMEKKQLEALFKEL